MKIKEQSVAIQSEATPSSPSSPRTQVSFSSTDSVISALRWKEMGYNARRESGEGLMHHRCTFRSSAPLTSFSSPFAPEGRGKEREWSRLFPLNYSVSQTNTSLAIPLPRSAPPPDRIATCRRTRTRRRRRGSGHPLQPRNAMMTRATIAGGNNECETTARRKCKCRTGERERD